MNTILIAGAGFSGCVSARLLADAGFKVVICERRDHIGGNAYDSYDSNGVLTHPYGPHIFHTNSKTIFAFLSRFTDWRFYEHRVLAKVGDDYLPIPVNRTTINKLYGLDLSSEEVEKFYESVKVKFDTIKNSEELVLSTVGEDLCDKFFRGYTLKQWGMPLSQLSSSVAARIPHRVDDDDRYFGDVYQFMPSNGYTALFNKLIEHNQISLQLDTDYFEFRGKHTWLHEIYTGPIDKYFNFEYGKLPYRSLRFEHEHLSNTVSYQQVGTVNFPNDFEYTRITEFKKITGQEHSGTSIVKEYSKADGDPFYPIPTEANQELYKKYRDLAEAEKGVSFIGRLAEYKYYNMDQAVGSAIAKCQDLISRLKS